MGNFQTFLLLLISILHSSSVISIPNKRLPNYITEEEFARVQGVKIVPSNITLPPYDQPIPSHPSPKPGFGPRIWTNAEVPYTLDASFSEEQREQFAIAFNAYHEDTCIRFIPKEGQHTSWVDILQDDGVCGLAHVCMNSGAQFAKFGGNCINPGTIVHELGHTLCMGHEHTRQDRDKWITFNTAICEPNLIDGDDFQGGLNKLYDYLSSQHFERECYNGCFQPTVPGVTKCGSGGPLSVLDIEVLNEVYGCDSGCLGYRYVNSLNASVDDMVPAGVETWAPGAPGETNYTTWYSCRAYHEGDLIPGSYNEGYKECDVTWKGVEYSKYEGNGDMIEVLTNPNEGSNDLQWVNTGGPFLPPNAVRGGRTSERETLYVIRCFLILGSWEYWIPGKFQPSTGAFMGYAGDELRCDSHIEFLTCNKQ